MSVRKAALRQAPPSQDDVEALRRQYGGRIELTGTPDSLYDRHVLFDNVLDPDATGLRARYEAVARSVRWSAKPSSRSRSTGSA